jgi:hypothetical protein
LTSSLEATPSFLKKSSTQQSQPGLPLFFTCTALFAFCKKYLLINSHCCCFGSSCYLHKGLKPYAFALA